MDEKSVQLQNKKIYYNSYNIVISVFSCLKVPANFFIGFSLAKLIGNIKEENNIIEYKLKMTYHLSCMDVFSEIKVFCMVINMN